MRRNHAIRLVKLYLAAHAAERASEHESARAYRDDAALYAMAHGIPAHVADGIRAISETSPASVSAALTAGNHGEITKVLKFS